MRIMKRVMWVTASALGLAGWSWAVITFLPDGAEGQTPTTVKSPDGGSTTVYGPVSRLPDGGVKILFR